jgi:hypothetical protein
MLRDLERVEGADGGDACSPIAPRLSSSGTTGFTAHRRTSASVLDPTDDALALEGSVKYALISPRVTEPTAGDGRSNWEKVHEMERFTAHCHT